MTNITKCELCSESNIEADHAVSANHLKNKALYEYSVDRKLLTGNRKGVIIKCNVKSGFKTIVDSTEAKIKISVKPTEEVKFRFKIMNDTKNNEMLLELVEIPKNNLNFHMNKQGQSIGQEPLILKPKTKLQKEVNVAFRSSNIGQYEMPIYFLIHIKSTNEKIFITRNMVVFVEEKQTIHEKLITPYTQKNIMADVLIKTKAKSNDTCQFRIPKNYKNIYAGNLVMRPDAPKKIHQLAAEVREVFQTGVTKDNYIRFFHNLLWYEETIIRINLKNYNMSGVMIQRNKDFLSLTVPGLAEKRPSLMLGDLLLLKPQNQEIMFEAVIAEINENVVFVKGLNRMFYQYHNSKALFDVRFFLSRIPLERMHLAIDTVMKSGHESKIFPVENVKVPAIKPIVDYYNILVRENPEQRQAVEHIVAGTSGSAPYLLHGPPGTGKTVTIVEAILQLTEKNPSNRILVCTDSNMAADHVATMLIKYTHMFDSEYFMLRVNSKFRVWQVLPECLIPFSNGSSFTDYESIHINDLVNYRIIVSTLSHAAKYCNEFKRQKQPIPITHLFIDEAAQASEPSTLIPVSGMLRRGGYLVLAGDPKQLGPVTISKSAKKIGLGLSLMERLKNTCPLYADERNDPNYEVMLRNNFRSNKDILELPNELFYKYQLRAHAKQNDYLSTVNILGERPTCRAIVFHGVLSKEQKMGKSPSFFNEMEAQIVQLYITRLVKVHSIQQEDIGIVTPYIRQVYKFKQWLQVNDLHKIEVGTVEAFQGKEKRVILISTVRANCSLLDHDAKFQLGFLVDYKRFNVALTRAKAKVVVVGNPLCLEKDSKWLKYIQKCRELGTCYGFDSASADSEGSRQQVVDRITPMLKSLSLTKSRV